MTTEIFLLVSNKGLRKNLTWLKRPSRGPTSASSTSVELILAVPSTRLFQIAAIKSNEASRAIKKKDRFARLTFRFVELPKLVRVPLVDSVNEDLPAPVSACGWSPQHCWAGHSGGTKPRESASLWLVSRAHPCMVSGCPHKEKNKKRGVKDYNPPKKKKRSNMYR